MKGVRAVVARRSTARFCMTAIGALLLSIGTLELAGAQKSTPSSSAATSAPSASAAVQHDSGLLDLPDNKPIRGMCWPALSPDGKTLCFTYLGNLWTVPVSGGTATRLTIHEALDAYPRWSPDGKFIAFTSFRSGNPDIFLIPAEGGEPRQVTFSSGSDWANAWSPDGKKLLLYGNGRDTKNFALFSIDLRTRGLKLLTHDEEPLRFGTWSSDGKHIAYTRGGMPWWRPWYRGSQAASTVVEDLDTGKVHTLLKTNTQQFWPLYAPDGRSLYISTIYGNSNTPNLYDVPVDGGTPRAVTHYATDAVRFPDIARNGSLLTYIYDGDLYTVKPDGTDARKVTIIARTDDKVNNQQRTVLHDHADESELSPDGKTLALVLRGNLWTVPVDGGDATRLTDNSAKNNDITWSPDGAKIVFVSDKDNQPDLYTIEVKTKVITRLTTNGAAVSSPTWSPDGSYIAFARAGAHPGLYVVPGGGGTERLLAEGNGNNDFGNGINSFSWSPDSKWLAFSRMDRYKVRDIWVVPAVGGTPINVTAYPDTNVEPKFTKDGKNLLFLSDRDGGMKLYRLPLEPETEASAPAKRSGAVKIDFTDIQQRAAEIPLPVPVDDYAPTPDGQHIVVHGGNNFWGAFVGGGPVMQITSKGEPGSVIEFVPNGSRFYYLGANGTPRSLALPPNPPGPPSVVAFTADLMLDRRLLYQQAFNEFYRQFGENFYDASMNGVNWAALRQKYEPLLQGIGTSFEFANLLSEMVGEVNSSHSEIESTERVSGPQTATLGLNYDYDYTGPGLKILSVMPKGPGDQPDSRIYPGDYLLSIDGTDVSTTEDYYQTLQDKAGKEVSLLVNNKPVKDGARTVKLKPINYGQWMQLDYDATIQRRRELVDKLSGGRLAYIHVRGMDEESLRKFQRELYSIAIRKEGLILDIRGNGGGNTHDQILQALSEHVYGYTQPRDGLRETEPARAFTKPVVLLIDQNSYSDAEVFPAAFRDMKLGKIVGETTPGYVIGTYEGKLVDGTTFRMPSWGFYTVQGKNLENLGIQPDILVENTPEDIAAHRDRQLEVAVKTLLRELPVTPDKTASADDSTVVFSSANANPNGGSSAVAPGRHPVRMQKP